MIHWRDRATRPPPIGSMVYIVSRSMRGEKPFDVIRFGLVERLQEGQDEVQIYDQALCVVYREFDWWCPVDAVPLPEVEPVPDESAMT